MTDDVKFMIDPQDAVPMDERAGSLPQPGEAVFYRLDIATTGRDIELRYTARKVWQGLSGHDDFKNKMADLINNGNGNIGNIRPKRTRDNDAGPAGRSKDTHLSINFDKIPLSYVVLKLSSRRNWQFSRTTAPFMMDRKDQGKGGFLEARRFDSSGAVINNATKADGCQFAYFIVDPSKFDIDADGGFQHRFNIQIDLLELDGPSIDSRIPIIIDPDVRHPGGNGEP
jgi:hypothetical protein